jgi:CubicO group peptidase (beta-lactamase class C family)
MIRSTALLFSGFFFAFCMSPAKRKLEPIFPVAPAIWYSTELDSLNAKKMFEQSLDYEKSIEILENKNQLLPLGNLAFKSAHISIGGNPIVFHNGLERYVTSDQLLRPRLHAHELKEWFKQAQHDVVFLSIHATYQTKIDSIDVAIFDEIPIHAKVILCVFGDKSILAQIPTKRIDAIILAKENHEIAQERVSQLIFGSIGATAKLGKELHSLDQVFSAGKAIQTSSNGRLKFSCPEEIGVDSKKLSGIDLIAQEGIEKGAYPGCQVLVAVNDQIIWRKCYGKQSYESEATYVQQTDVYDIASVTKIAASTLLAMHLQSKGQYSLDKKLKDYIPEVTGDGPFGNILIRDMMAHQAGLTPWIPFYKRTIQNGQWNTAIYSQTKKAGFEHQVATGLYINDSYADSMYAQILKSTLGPKKYEYSDLCYYFTQKILEKQIGQKQNTFLEKQIYRPMGLRYMRYLPLEHFDRSHIIPTENDQAFRKQLLHGFVHDPGAAMLGGVAGHAGIFANATDLASIMQLFLNKGQYAGMEFFSESVCNEYTKQQFPGNRRGAGFDRPNASGGGTCDELASSQSFGHSGFTGTLAWADPKNKVIFIFLSNRVNPSQDNWKIRDMNIRTRIQHVIYQSLQ